MAKLEKWSIEEVNELLKSVSVYGKVDGLKKFVDKNAKRTYESARKKLQRIDINDFVDEIDVEELSRWEKFKIWVHDFFFRGNTEIVDEES